MCCCRDLEPAGREVVNDLNGRIVNWWLQVRDNRDALQDKLRHMPISGRRIFFGEPSSSSWLWV